MDQDLAKRLYVEGAILIVAGIPVGTEFGIDLTTYTIGERFRGVKMIPPGVHYVYTSSQGPYGDTSPRVGFVHFFKKQEILVKEWDPENEQLRSRITQNAELEKKRIRDNILELDKFLGPYDFNSLLKWKNLINAIDENTVLSCAPECGLVRTNIELLSCPDSERPRGSNIESRKQCSRILMDENDLLPDLKPIPGAAPRFTLLPNRIPQNALPSAISQSFLDSIDAIEIFFSKFKNLDDLIREIQLAFIFFHPGTSVEGLIHWRRILNLLCNSQTAVEKYKLFYRKYLECLQYQLPELPEELMEQNNKNTVYKDVRKLLLNCSLSEARVGIDNVIRHLSSAMNWNFDGLTDEDPEDLPVIVDI